MLTSKRTAAAVSLKHLPEHRVLLCVFCTYCVLPGALERHLKDIHRLPQHECRRIALDSQRLDLVSSAEQVVIPAPGAAAIPDLPVHDGFVCAHPTGCAHACMTVKRMQAHWRNSHGRTAHRGAGAAAFWCAARLQTFFRGNHLRYFVVSGTAHPPRLRDEQDDDEDEDDDDEAAAIGTAAIAGMQPDAFTFEAELCRQFRESTYRGLLPSQGSEETWRDRIMEEASEYAWLRHAVLSLAAAHRAVQAPAQADFWASAACRYRDRGMAHLRSQWLCVREENLWAVSNFCRLMPLACIASSRWTDDPLRLEWCEAQRLGRAHLWPFRRQFRAGVRDQEQHRDPTSNPDDLALSSLADLFSLYAGSFEITPCLGALAELRGAWAMPYQQDRCVTMRDASLLWGIRTPSTFFDLVEAKDPMALVVLAHFCVLWSIAEENHWYMRGYSLVLLACIRGALPAEWISLLDWPVERISVDPGLTSQAMLSELEMARLRFEDDFETSVELWDPDHLSEISNEG